MTTVIHNAVKSGLLACALCCLLGFPVALLASGSVLVIKSSDNRFFNTTIEHLIDNAPEQAQFTVKTLQAMRDNDNSLSDAQLIVTLGYEAAKHVAAMDTDIPALHSYLTEFQYNSQDPKPNHHSILLEQPLDRYVRFIKGLLAVNSIGIVKPADDPIATSRLLQIQRELAININQSIFNEGDNAVDKIRQLLQDNDVLLTLPAPAIYNRQSLKGILLASYRLKKPVISYSPAHVKSGALAAIYTSPENIGNHLAHLVKRLLTERGFHPRSFYYPAEFDISINDRVARSLDLDLQDRETLLEQLRQQERVR